MGGLGGVAARIMSSSLGLGVLGAGAGVVHSLVDSPSTEDPNKRYMSHADPSVLLYESELVRKHKNEKLKETIVYIENGFDGVKEENLLPVLEWLSKGAYQ